jgi:hypothetical protein
MPVNLAFGEDSFYGYLALHSPIEERRQERPVEYLL